MKSIDTATTCAPPRSAAPWSSLTPGRIDLGRSGAAAAEVEIRRFDLDGVDAAFIATGPTDLIARTAGQVALTEGGGCGRVRTDMLHRIQGFAKQRLDDPSLGLVTLTRQHNVSVRYIQKLFQEHGSSPAGWIGRERLARCMTDLKDPGKADVSATLIGRRRGFRTASSFTRAFRRSYGLTPRRIRTARGLGGA